MTPARAAALERANTARRWCPSCRTHAPYVIPAHLGTCLDCADPTSIQEGHPR